MILWLQKLKTKHLEVTESLHDSIKAFCFYYRLNIKDFVTSELSNLPKLKKFSEQRKRYVRLKNL